MFTCVNFVTVLILFLEFQFAGFVNKVDGDEEEIKRKNVDDNSSDQTGTTVLYFNFTHNFNFFTQVLSVYLLCNNGINFCLVFQYSEAFFVVFFRYLYILAPSVFHCFTCLLTHEWAMIDARLYQRKVT